VTEIVLPSLDKKECNCERRHRREGREEREERKEREERREERRERGKKEEINLHPSTKNLGHMAPRGAKPAPIIKPFSKNKVVSDLQHQ
jgi:hypothetical protein